MKSQKIFGWFLIISVLAFPLGTAMVHSEEILPPPVDVHASIQVLFAPGNKPAEAIAKAIDEAGIEVLVMSYQLTSKPIVESLFSARDRGVDVEIILDQSTCDAKRFAEYKGIFDSKGIPVSCDRSHPIHHNKVVIIDRETVITGSFNFSPSAERNAENTMVIRHVPEIASQYVDVWKSHREHSGE